MLIVNMDCMPTILDVARRAGVSIGTVSNVIRGTARVSPELRKRVASAIHQLGYYPGRLAEPVRIKQTCMLGMILPDITNPFFPEIMRGAEDRAFERGYLLVTANTDERIEREKQIVSVLRSRRIDGILLAASSGKGSGHIRAVIHAGIPVVCLDRPASGVQTDAVLLDNLGGARQCVRHLIDSGHRNIAIITGPLALLSARERLEGYHDALRDSKTTDLKSTILEGDYRKDSGHRLGRKLARMRKRPDAVFVCNGVMALGVLEAFEELGVDCRRDIVVATFDDLRGESLIHRRLTTVLQPSYDIGSRAASLLMDRVEGELTGPPMLIRVSPRIALAEDTLRRSRRSIHASAL
jgi:LacI family transcriptional regulator